MSTVIPIKRTYTGAFEAARTLGTLMCPPGLSWVTELAPGNADPAEIILHISCNAHFTLFIPYIAQEILKKLNKKFIVFGGPESCCGSIQFNMGDHDLEAKNAKIALLAFNRVKPSLLVSVCPDCDEVFEKFRLPQTRFEIANLSELLPRYLEELKPFLRTVKRKVILHHHTIDSARTADGTNMRLILEAIPGIEIVEAHRHIGPGIHCQTQKPMPASDQEAMFAEATALGVDTLVVPYHSCYRQHIKMELRSPVRVQHYLGIMAESLGIDFDEPLKSLRLLGTVDAAMNALEVQIKAHDLHTDDVRTYLERAVFL